MDDLRHMRNALVLARRGLGNVWPNPAVGCVIVHDDRVVGRGWTQPGGRPHAETEALAQAGAAAKGATAYVTLEPCSHWGKTGPCAEALIGAGIARVVIALGDPDPRVSGQGIARLRVAGITVEIGLCAGEAAEVNAGFLRRVGGGRPLVTLKLATTLDGRIATHQGESQWITGAPARDTAHLLRANHDGVMIGSGTALADDPLLTCRLAGLGHRSPVRIVADSRLRVPLTARLVADARNHPTWFLTRADSDPTRQAAFRDCGVELILLPGDEGAGVDVGAALTALGGAGLTRLLVEGGGKLAASLLSAGLVDRLAWFRAPSILGGDGIPAVSGFGLDHLADMPRFELTRLAEAGEDLLETYRRLP